MPSEPFLLRPPTYANNLPQPDFAYRILGVRSDYFGVLSLIVLQSRDCPLCVVLCSRNVGLRLLGRDGSFNISSHKIQKRKLPTSIKKHHGNMRSPTANSKSLPGRGSASEQFPGKLHALITYAEHAGLSDIICWSPNGRVMMVRDPDRLVDILPKFGLRQTKYRSFERQLNMWHWERITQEPYKGGWTHTCFVRGHKSLCNLMSRHCPPERENTFTVKSCSMVHHAIMRTEASDLPMHRGLVNKCYIQPSVPRWQPPTWVSGGSIDEFHTPAWEMLFDALCNEDSEEYVQQTQQQDERNSTQLFFGQHNIDALYDSILPTAVVEPEFIIEPTPFKEDWKPPVATSLSEPL